MKHNKLINTVLGCSAFTIMAFSPNASAVTLAQLNSLHKEVKSEMQEGQYDIACGKLDKLNNQNLPNQTLFLMGQCKAALGETVTAIEKYEAILKKEPNRARVQLELAQQYFVLGKLKQSKELFEGVNKSSIPPNVASNIKRHITAIQKRYEWHGNVSIGYVYDSNVNNSPNDPNIQAFGLPFVLSTDSLETNDNALTGSVSIGRVFDGPFADLWRIDAYTNVRDYRTEDTYDYHSIGLSVGPQFFGEFNINLPLGISTSWENGKRASTSISFVPSISTEISKGFSLTSRITLNRSNDLRDNPLSNGNAIGLDVGVDHKTSKNSSIGANVSRYNNDANDLNYNRYQSNGLTVNYNYRFENGTSISIQPSINLTDYNSSDPVDSGVVRSDSKKSINVNIWKETSIAGINFTPILGLSYSKNDSNIERRKFERSQVNLQLRKSF